MGLQEVVSLIGLIAGCLCTGICVGIVWERHHIDDEWRRWLTLSERVDSMSTAWEHDMYILEDRLGRTEDNLIWTQTQCLHYKSEEYEDIDHDEEITQEIPVIDIDNSSY